VPFVLNSTTAQYVCSFFACCVIGVGDATALVALRWRLDGLGRVDKRAILEVAVDLQ